MSVRCISRVAQLHFTVLKPPSAGNSAMSRMRTAGVTRSKSVAGKNLRTISSVLAYISGGHIAAASFSRALVTARANAAASSAVAAGELIMVRSVSSGRVDSESVIEL
jgi:hypothetical protein